MHTHIYFVPGFDPVGPSRYLSMIKSSCRAISDQQNISLIYSFDPKLSQWPALHISSEQKSKEKVSIYIASYIDVIQKNWNLSSIDLVLRVGNIFKTYIMQGLGYSFMRDFRISLFLLLQLISVQAALIGPIMIAIACLALLIGNGISGFYAIVISMLFGACLTRLCWFSLDRLKLLWLVKAMLFQSNIARAGDQSLNSKASLLCEQLKSIDAKAPAGNIIFMSHSSGASLLLLLINYLLKDASFNFLKRSRIITLGRSMPVYIDDNQLRQSLDSLIFGQQLPWLDITTLDDLLSDALIQPAHYLGRSDPSSLSTAYPERVSVDYSCTKEFPTRVRGIFGLVQFLFQQFDLHFLYLLVKESAHNNSQLRETSLPLIIMKYLGYF